MTQFREGVAIVAGGSGGIGAEICRTLARAGANVAFTYRSRRQAAAEVCAAIESEGRQAFSMSVNHADEQAMKQFVQAAAERFGRVHSVVYAAGPHLDLRLLSEMSPSEWRGVVEADVIGAFNLVWSTLPLLKAGGGGSYVAIITAAVEKVPMRDISSAAPKAAIEMLFRGIALEEGRHGIRSNCVAPGFINAGMGAQLIAKSGIEDWVERLRKTLPLKTFGEAADVAQATLFLLSDRAKYISGQSLAVDGGLQL